MSIILEKQKPITREVFLDEIKEGNTRKNHESALSSYDKFLKSQYENIDESTLLKEMVNGKSNESYVFLNQMVKFWDESLRLDPASVKNYTSCIRNYFRAMGIKTYNEDVKEHVKFPRKLKERRKPLTFEIIQKLLMYSNPKYKALFLTLASSGMRIGEAVSIKVKHLEIHKDYAVVTIPAGITKTKQERETYISQEALKMLLPLIKDKDGDDFVFRKSKTQSLYNARLITQVYLHRLRDRLELSDKYDNGRHVINIHAFRAFFITKATMKHGDSYAHAVSGHNARDSYLPQYYRLEPEERLRKYKQLEPLITISNEQRQKLEIDEKDKQIFELSKMKTDIRKLQAEVRRVKAINEN